MSPAPGHRSGMDETRRTPNPLCVCLALGLSIGGLWSPARAADSDHQGPGHRMIWDANGMVMGENQGDQLPLDCSEIREDHSITVKVGRQYAPEGFIYGYDQPEWSAPPCSRLSVTLINEDQVRHMWMLHGLPGYLYYQGMFHLEAEGGKTITGTFITPSDDRTYFVHCDVSQHTEKGLKGQLKVGRGSGDEPGIPGLTPPRYTGITEPAVDP